MICLVLYKLLHVLFADDTTFILKHSNLAILQENLKKEVTNLST